MQKLSEHINEALNCSCNEHINKILNCSYNEHIFEKLVINKNFKSSSLNNIFATEFGEKLGDMVLHGMFYPANLKNGTKYIHASTEKKILDLYNDVKNIVDCHINTWSGKSKTLYLEIIKFIESNKKSLEILMDYSNDNFVIYIFDVFIAETMFRFCVLGKKEFNCGHDYGHIIYGEIN